MKDKSYGQENSTFSGSNIQSNNFNNPRPRIEKFIWKGKKIAKICYFEKSKPFLHEIKTIPFKNIHNKNEVRASLAPAFKNRSKRAYLQGLGFNIFQFNHNNYFLPTLSQDLKSQSQLKFSDFGNLLKFQKKKKKNAEEVPGSGGGG